MANIRLIKRRIRSTKNIAQITRAMEMVAASKMKKAQEAASRGRIYADKIYTVTRQLVARTDTSVHPLLGRGNPGGAVLVIMISTNKGLCGGLNTNLFRQLSHWFPDHQKTSFISIGKKGESFLVKSGRTLDADFSESLPFESSVSAVIDLVVAGFLKGTYGQVYVAFSAFKSALKQEPTRKLILPLTVQPSEDEHVEALSDFLIEPDVDDVLSHLLPHYLENQLRSAVFETEASEHSARMVAMKNATDAALDFMHALTLEYNKARQEKITYEIADVVTARMAFD